MYTQAERIAQAFDPLYELARRYQDETPARAKAAGELFAQAFKVPEQPK